MDDQPEMTDHQATDQPPRQALAPRRWRVWRGVLKNHDILWTTRLMLGVSLLLAAIVTVLFHSAERDVVLHYSILFGIDRVGHWVWLLSLPAVLVASAVVNLLVVTFVGDRSPLATGLVAAGNAALTLVVTFATALLILVNQGVAR